MKKQIQPTCPEIVSAVKTVTAPFDAMAISKASGRSVMECMRALAAMTGTGLVAPLNESPEGESHHVSERYMRVEMAQ
jgi:hypothetical protein